MQKIDAWKLYTEAFRELWPTAKDVSSYVSPAALQEMVDRISAKHEAELQALREPQHYSSTKE